MTDSPLPVDAGLLGRLRAAGGQIAWREAARGGRRARGAKAPGTVRIAHLHDEEARVEARSAPGRHALVVDSGPVGALVVLLEVDRRGRATRLIAREAGEVPGFDHGAIEAEWGGAPDPTPGLPIADLVALARYALA